ncbi:MAG: hypothetical protein Q9217_004321 [Psora testacea]
MAEENVHKQEFLIRNLCTNSVTLYPTRAQVVRDINDITLKVRTVVAIKKMPGSNEITIYGLTPTADESSIKVDGKGSATITDMMVELVENRDRYDDVYPSEPEDDNDSSDTNDPDDDTEGVKVLEEQVERIDQAINKAKEENASAQGCLNILEVYGKSVEKDRPKDVHHVLSQYRLEREEAYAAFTASEKKTKDLASDRQKIWDKLRKAISKAEKAKIRANKAKAKEKEMKQRAKEDKLQAKRQLKADRGRFWAKKVYRVVVSLDTYSDMTPATSRRGSVSTVGKVASETTTPDLCQISLSVSYITSFASWAPRYDLSLNTPSSSGTITYRAEFSNTTSETWKDAKVILSTSQTAFQGIGEPIPIMQPWHIRLAKGTPGTDSSKGALNSNHELQYKHNNQTAVKSRIVQPRDVLFGLGKSNQQLQQMLPQKLDSSLAQHQQAQHQQAQQQMQQNAYSGFGGGGLFGNVQAGQHPQAPSSGPNYSSHANQASLFNANRISGDSRSQAMGPLSQHAAAQPDLLEYSDGEDEGFAQDQQTIIPDLPSLATQESAWSESGMTATYDIPGLRTMIPSHTTRRHKIASIHLKDVQLSYLIIPKHRVAAFLKARLRNTSSVTLLRGPTGLTLDGSFLGNTNLPRCSVGESFSLSLGVDPSVSVTYGKPVVRRSQSGIINKEGSGIYTRTCTVTNTKANRPIEGLVLDQVPVSEDERLKIEILQPRGLRKEGDSVRAGVGLNSAGKEEPKWGKATAVVKKGGEICWDFKIEASKGAKFVLEYEARYPSGEMVVCN